jgi:integrase/recombinase XerD
LGHRLLDDYLDMVAARARPNTVLAAAFDLKVFFAVVGRNPVEVTEADVLGFIRPQRQPRRGCASRTVRRGCRRTGSSVAWSRPMACSSI